jgi:hypothetical protein
VRSARRPAAILVVAAVLIGLGAPGAVASGPSEATAGPAAPRLGVLARDEAPVDRAARSEALAAVRSAPVTGEIGGAVIPTRSKALVSVEFAGAGEQRIDLPAEGSRPAELAGAFVQVTVSAPSAGQVEISLNGDREDRWTPAVVADAELGAGRYASSTTLVRTGAQVWVRSTGAASVWIRVVAWVRDEPRADVPAGGVGIAVRPSTAFSTRGLESADDFTASLASEAGVGVYMTGQGGIPAQAAQMVFVQAQVDPIGDAARPLLQAQDPQGRWQNVAMLSGTGVQSHLIAVVVDEVGFVRLRATDSVRATFTPVGWVSRGYPTLRASQLRSVFPILGDTIALGTDTDSTAEWEQAVVPGLPRGGAAVMAILHGQAIGTGNVRIDGGDPGEWADLAVDGLGSAAVFVADAQDGITVRSTRGVRVHVQAVAYLLTAAPEGDAQARSRAERPRVVIDAPRGASADQRRTGQFTLTGRARSARGIAEVRVGIPGTGQRAYASVESATGAWSIDLRLPEGTTQVTVTVTDLGGRSARARVPVTITPDDGRTPQVAADLRVLSRDLQKRIVRIGPGYIDFRGRQAPRLVPGGVLSAPAFPKAPEGLLRKVDTLRQVAPEIWRVFTSQAGLADAVVNGTLGQRDRTARFTRGNPLVARWDFAVPVDLKSEDIFDMREQEGVGIAFQGALKGRLAVAGSSSFAIGLRIQTKWGFIPVGVEVTYFEYTYDNRIRIISDQVAFGVGDGALVAIAKPMSKPYRFTIPVMTGIAVTGGFTPEYELLLNGSLELTGEASVRTNLRFIYDRDRGGWQEVTDDWFTEPMVNADLTFDGNSKLGIGGRVDVGINDAGGAELELMLGVIGVKGQGTFRVRSGLADQPDAAGLDCDAQDADLDVYSTFDLQLRAFVGPESWPLVRLDPWREAWYTC